MAAQGQPLEPKGAQVRALISGLGVELLNSTKTCLHTLRAARKGSRTLQALRAPGLALRSTGGSGSGVPDASGAYSTGASGSGLPEVFSCSPGRGHPSGTAGAKAPGALTGTLARTVRLRFHSSNLVLGGASARFNYSLGPVMITANDLSQRPDLVSLRGLLRTEGRTHTQHEMLGHPGEPEGAGWATNPSTLHWCRDQDCARVCVLTPAGRLDLLFFSGSSP